MKKTIAVTPTILLFLVILIGFGWPGITIVDRSSMVIYSLVGLAIYAFFTIFIYGVMLSAKGQRTQDMSASSKWLFVYMIAILIVVLGIALFMMTHN